MLSRRIYAHIRANAVAYAALFFAITGSAAAINKIQNRSLGTGSVNSRAIRNHTVEGKDLHKNSIRSATVVDGSLHGNDLAFNTITGTQIDESTLDPTVLQFRIQGSCPPGQAINAVGPEGQVVCEQRGTGTITGIATSGGLTGGGSAGNVNLGVDPTKIQTRVSGVCPGAEAIQTVFQDGTVDCEPNVTSVDSGFGLTGGPITNSGTISADTSVLQQRVTGTCTGNSAVRQIGSNGAVGCTRFVTRVGTGAGLVGGPITDTGTVSADTTYLQRRVRGTCSGNQAIQSVGDTGTVGCSPDFVPSGQVLTPRTVQVAAGGSEPLLEANGIRIIGACPISPLSADVKVASTGGTVVAYGRSQSLGFVKATTTSTAKLGSSATGDRGEFNAFLSATGDTLDGSFMSFTSGGNCTFEASALAS